MLELSDVTKQCALRNFWCHKTMGAKNFLMSQNKGH